MTKEFFKEKCPESKKYENNLKRLYKLTNNCSKVSYIIMDEEYDKKWNELLDINLRIDIPVSACKSTYSYSADAFRINVDFYKKVTLNKKKFVFLTTTRLID